MVEHLACAILTSTARVLTPCPPAWYWRVLVLLPRLNDAWLPLPLGRLMSSCLW